MNIIKTQIQIVLALFLISLSAVFFDYVISGYDTTPKGNYTVETGKTEPAQKEVIAVQKTVPAPQKAETTVAKATANKTETKPKQNVQTADKPAPKPNTQMVSNAKPKPAHVSTKGRNEVKEDIVKHSIAMDVDPVMALTIAKIESNFDHNKRSVNGAVGVFQILPSTARSMGYDAYSANDNIKSGITYYKKMYQKFGDVDLALAAYNAGPGNVSRHNGVPPFAETKRFINKIKNEYENQKNDPILEKYQNRQM